MPKITRLDLKHNFLKNIIIRMDLSGAFPQEIETAVIDLKPFFKSAGFQRFQEKATNEFNVEITGASLDDVSPQSQVKLTDNYKIYNFTDESRGISIDITHLYICVTVKNTKYINFADYLQYLIRIYEILSEKIDFISIKRIGLRKINSCLFKDKTEITTCFSSKYFNLEDFDTDTVTLASGQKYLLSNKNKKINLATDIQEGELESNIVYQLIIDTDIYITEDIFNSKSLELEKEILEMNDIIFNIYIKIITPMFLGKLCSDEDIDLEYLIGVDRNE